MLICVIHYVSDVSDSMLLLRNETVLVRCNHLMLTLEVSCVLCAMCLLRGQLVHSISDSNIRMDICDIDAESCWQWKPCSKNGRMLGTCHAWDQ